MFLRPWIIKRKLLTMENNQKIKSEWEKRIDLLHDEIHRVFDLKKKEKEEGTLNSKILNITMKIKDQYPELSKYLEEMSETIPYEKNPEMNSDHLQKYYDSLKAMLNKYILEHPELEK
jgi:hypothetical protein